MIPTHGTTPAVRTRTAYGFAHTAFRAGARLFTKILLAIVLCWVALEVMVVAGQRFGFVYWSAMHLAFLVVAAGLQLGFVGIALDIHDGRTPTYRSLFEHLAQGGRFLGSQVLYLVIVLVGLTLLVVPGFIWAARFSLFPYVMADREQGPVASLRTSAELTRGRFGKVGGVLALLFVANLAGAALLGLGLLAAIPISVLTMAAAYRQFESTDSGPGGLAAVQPRIG